MVCITARLRPVYGPALAPDRGANRAYPGASRAFLPPELAAGSGNFAAALGLVRAGAFASQKPAHRLVQKMGIHLGREYRVGQFHLTHGFPLQISDLDD